MKISELKQSRFLTKEDCDPPICVTIAGVRKENVSPAGEKPDEKWCLLFSEDVKPMVLNSTNGSLIARFLGSDDSDGWTGKTIVLYHDPSVTFAGKLVGGIRVRKASADTLETLKSDIPW
jgi:hypothetical protein